MSNTKQQQSIRPNSTTANEGVDIMLDDNELSCLAGYFDVLIQMDFAQKQRNEQRSKDEQSLSDRGSDSSQVD